MSTASVELLQLGAGIIVREDPLEIPPLLGERLGAPLAEARAVAEAAAGQGGAVHLERERLELGVADLLAKLHRVDDAVGPHAHAAGAAGGSAREHLHGFR